MNKDYRSAIRDYRRSLGLSPEGTCDFSREQPKTDFGTDKGLAPHRDSLALTAELAAGPTKEDEQ